jgi:hypothetical protein
MATPPSHRNVTLHLESAVQRGRISFDKIFNQVIDVDMHNPPEGIANRTTFVDECAEKIAP